MASPSDAPRKPRPKPPKAVDLALAALELEQRKPTEDDAPAKPSTFPGPKPRHIDGQLSLDDAA